MNIKKTKEKIKEIFNKEKKNNKKEINLKERDTILNVIELLNDGKIKVSKKKKGQWITYQWIKKAILLYFKIQKTKVFIEKNSNFFDKIPLKYKNYSKEKFLKEKVRIAPNATVRYGSFINKNSILMPCFVNIGANIGKNTMLDTWSTVGSCAQIGNNVHISGGVGIGGVLEPIQSNPTIIEDNCFIGARSEIVEGVIIKKGSVISMGVYIGKSTKIYDREKKTITYGVIPKGSVVVPGSIYNQKDKKHSLYAAIIVKKVDINTLKKVEINQLLRDI